LTNKAAEYGLFRRICSRFTLGPTDSKIGSTMNRNRNNLTVFLQKVVTSGYPVKFPTLFFENLDYLFTVHTRKVYQIRYIVNEPEPNFFSEQALVGGEAGKSRLTVGMRVRMGEMWRLCCGGR